MASPPAGIDLVAKAVLIMKGEKNHSWTSAQKMMGNPKQFLEFVQKYDLKTITDSILKQLDPILKTDGFNYENMLRKSSAGGNLCNWVINAVKFNEIYKNVKPLMESAEAAEKLANEKLAELAVVQEKVRLIIEKVDALKAQLDAAVAKKKAVEDDANALQLNLSLANRLVNGLADEQIRWSRNV
jgi:dynein heavy chain